MGLREILTGQAPSLRGVFAPVAMGAAPIDRTAVLASYAGPGRDRFLRMLERAGRVPVGTAEAAASGMSSQVLARVVQEARRQASGAVAVLQPAQAAGRQTLGMAASVATDGIAVAANPVYDGLMGQMLRARGLLPAGIAPVAVMEQPVALVAREAPAAVVAADAVAAGVLDDMLAVARRGSGTVVGALEGAAHSMPAVTEAAATASRLVRPGRMMAFADAVQAALRVLPRV